MRPMIIAAIACLAAGCSTAEPAARPLSARQVQAGVEFELAQGEAAQLAGSTTVIVFERVIEDSRCPMNARCVWEGNAKVSLRIGDPKGRAAAYELNTSDRFATRQRVGGHDIVLLRLAPTPMTHEKVEKYTVTLRVEPAA